MKTGDSVGEICMLKEANEEQDKKKGKRKKTMN